MNTCQLSKVGGGISGYDSPDLLVISLTAEQGFAASGPGLDDPKPGDISGGDLVDDSDNWGW